MTKRNTADAADWTTAFSGDVPQEELMASEYEPTPLGSIVKATNGREYKVVWAQRTGANTRRAAPTCAEDLGLVLNSPRAKATYMGLRRTDGRIEVIRSV